MKNQVVTMSHFMSSIFKLSFMASILLVGCHMIPAVEHKPMVLPKKTRNGTAIVPTADSMRCVLWWKKMHDPILNRLICAGLNWNNQIKSAGANIRQAQAQLREARYAWLPTLNAYGNGFIGGGWDSHVTPQGPLASSKALSKTTAINFRGYFSGFEPRYTLNIMQNLQNTKFAKASLAMQKANYQSTKLSIISQISGSYFMLVGEVQQLQDEKTYLKDLQHLRSLEWDRYIAGASDLTTISNLDQQIGAYAANIATLKDSISQIENSIQTLINQNPAPLIIQVKLSQLSTEHVIPKTLPATVLINRPDVLMALHNVHMSKANIGLAYSKFFPAISLTNLLGSSSLDLRHLLTISTGLWLVQGSITLPALDAVSWEKIKEAKSGYVASVYNYLQTLRNALADVDNSLTTYQHNCEAYRAQIRALTAAKQAYTLSKSRYL